MIDYEFARDGWNVCHTSKQSKRMYIYEVCGSLKDHMELDRKDRESGSPFYDNFNVGYCLLTRRESAE